MGSWEGAAGHETDATLGHAAGRRTDIELAPTAAPRPHLGFPAADSAAKTVALDAEGIQEDPGNKKRTVMVETAETGRLRSTN